MVQAGWTASPERDCGPDAADQDPTAARLDQRSSVGSCATDTWREPSPVVLGYGSTVRSGDLRCTSQESGMTCDNTATGAGFTVSRQGYELR